MFVPPSKRTVSELALPYAECQAEFMPENATVKDFDMENF